MQFQNGLFFCKKNCIEYLFRGLESALMQQLSKYPILAVTGVLPLKTRYQT